MKKIKNILWGLLVIAFSGCQQFLDINVDPTLKSDVNMSDLLSTAIFYTGETSYRQSYITSQYIQQIGSATSSGSLDAQDDTDNATGWTEMYLNVLPHLNLIVEKSKIENAPAYTGIANTLIAYNLGVATTCWENIPYSKADKKDFAPDYDTQEQVYAEIQKLLDAAIASLAQTGGAKPAADDLIYKGDLGKWTRLAYTLKARFAMHLTKKNATNAANTALAALQNGMKSNDDDFQLIFNSRNLHPWYSRVALSNATGNLSVTHGATFMNLMNGSTTFPVVDPRLTKIATLRRNQTSYNGTRPGANQGATVDFSATSWYSSQTSPLQFCTYAEAKALEAEARFIAGGGSRTSKGSTKEAYAAYQAIASANMARMGVTTAEINAYLSAKPVDVGQANLTLNDIMREKYKSMFLMGDLWTDFRRYDYLFLPYPENPNVDLGGKTIQRLMYPLSESTRNSKVYQANFKTMGEVMWMFK